MMVADHRRRTSIMRFKILGREDDLSVASTCQRDPGVSDHRHE